MSRWIQSLALAALALLAGCSAPISATRVGATSAREEVTANFLDTGELSTATMLALRRGDLEEVWYESPGEAIESLHRLAVAGDRKDRLFALSELCIHEAERLRSRRYHLGAAVYAYLLLFGEPEEQPSPYDDRFRTACRLYNRSVGAAFLDEPGGDFEFRSGLHELPVGSLDVTADKQRLPRVAKRFVRYLPADEYELSGLRSRNRQAGLGATLIGEQERANGPIMKLGFMGPNTRVAFTAFLRIRGGLAEMERGLTARLELHDPLEEAAIGVGGRTVPLSADVTAPLALGLRESKLWDFELAGFLSGDHEDYRAGLGMMRPYEPGKIPVVFVHGTASSPARWAEMFNELQADQRLRERYQFWFFIYETGNPILYSAHLLRDSLRDVIATVDPGGEDGALQNMVLVGHSQGGLLTRLQITDSGDAFSYLPDGRHLDDLPLPEAQKDALLELAVFERLPFVQRVIFICTPHGGSFVAGGLLGAIGSNLVSLPRRVLDYGKGLIGKGGLFENMKMKTAVDNMAPGSRFVVKLSGTTPHPDVHLHSIVAIDGSDEPPEGDDGVVEYTSAHLEQADSELIVRWNHSAQGHPRVVMEVRRVLHEALDAER